MTERSKLTRRRFLTATGGAAAAATLAGCLGDGGGGGGNKKKSNNKVDNPDSSKTLKEILPGTITTFDPVAATDSASGVVIQQMFDALTNYPDAKQGVKNQLATDYKVSGDKKTYTFTLKDAKYHNGKTVKAADFVYAFERLAASKNSRRANFITSKLGVQHETKKVTKDGQEQEVYVPKSIAVKAVDEKTLEITLQQPHHSALAVLAYTAFAALPKGIVGDIEGEQGEMKYQEFATKNPVGAGPFKFKKWGGGEAEVTRYDGYHGGKASVAGVHFQVLEKDNPRFKHAMNKEADVFEIPTSKYKPELVKIDDSRETDFGGEFGTYGPVENGSTLNHYRIVPLATFWIAFNMAKVPKPVRKAFAYATNQNELVNTLFKGRGKAATHMTPPNIYPGGKEAYEAHTKEKYPYNAKKSELEKAKQIMQDAGYSKDKKFSLQLTRYQSTTWDKVVKRLRDKLASAHIQVNINPTDFSTLTQQGRQGKLEVYTLGWIADWPAGDNFLQLINPPQTDTSKPAPVSYLNWKPENGSEAQKATDAFKRIDQNKQPTEEAKKIREKAYIEMEEANWEDVGILPIYHDREEWFWYNWAELQPFGVMGRSRQMRNHSKVGKRS